MYLIGIFANCLEYEIIKRNIIETMKNEHLELINITTKNIENMKNIMFETIVLCSKQNINEVQKDVLNKLCSHCKYIIMNADAFSNTKIISDKKTNCVTYGLNQKSTITISSMQEDKAIISIQRNIYNIEEKEIGMGEISIDLKKYKKNNIENLLAIFSIYLIYKNKITEN